MHIISKSVKAKNKYHHIIDRMDNVLCMKFTANSKNNGEIVMFESFSGKEYILCPEDELNVDSRGIDFIPAFYVKSERKNNYVDCIFVVI